MSAALAKQLDKEVEAEATEEEEEGEEAKKTKAEEVVLQVREFSPPQFGLFCSQGFNASTVSTHKVIFQAETVKNVLVISLEKGMLLNKDAP